jgi:nitrilase
VVPYYPYYSIVQSGYQILRGGEFVKLLDQSVTVPSLATEALGEACRQAGIASIGVNERYGGTIYNTQLLFDADGALIQRRRKITPTHYERMIWGQAMAQVCAPSPVRSHVLVNWRVLSTTTHWHGTR